MEKLIITITELADVLSDQPLLSTTGGIDRMAAPNASTASRPAPRSLISTAFTLEESVPPTASSLHHDSNAFLLFLYT